MIANTELLALSAERADLFPTEVLDSIRDPDWDNTSRMYDWRNHVSLELKLLWPRLSKEAQLAVFLQAATEAYDEEGWDPV